VIDQSAKFFPLFFLSVYPDMAVVLGLVCILVLLVAMASAKRYDVHDVVGIMANTVGPFNNPTEKYPVRFENPS
jgi:hypothetical protein